LVNRILATVIILFLPHFSIWQFSAACISFKTHPRTIYYVYRPMSVWLVITRGYSSRKSSHEFRVVLMHDRKARSLESNSERKTQLYIMLNLNSQII